ncbi:hydroxylysine kinase-like [Entelurus aequoreus]|uniref:hydroxylysine kinase-like n=1 Tax=Entelurus aequoreus TaxID=161455 RepID=UPI002B1CF2B7|nr:hydroxylysine kinase-like [Entelurus aequoreus]
MSEKSTKPNLSQSQAAELVKKRYNLTASEVSFLPAWEDQNLHVVTEERGQFVLKIMNSEDSKKPAVAEVQTYAMNFLREKGLPTQNTLKTTTGQVMFLEDIDCGHGLQKFLVRLLTYLPGIQIAKAPFSPQLLYDVGQSAARMDLVLKEMKHPQLSVLQRDDLTWSLSNVLLLEKYMNVVDGHPLQAGVRTVLHQYKTCVAPKYSAFRKCVIHGDINDLNVLVQADESNAYKISGIIDFGEIHFGYYVHELAITIMYMMLEHPKPIEVGGAILAGWESIFPLNKTEKDCLFWLVLSRFCQTLVLSRYAVTLQPENEEYLMYTSKNGVRILLELLKVGKGQVEKVWFQTAADLNHKKTEIKPSN